MARITNNWDFSGWFNREEPQSYALVILGAISFVAGFIGTCLLIFGGYFAWYLLLPVMVGLYFVYKFFTGADFFFRNSADGLGLWNEYTNLPKPVKKEMGKVDPKVLRDMSDMDSRILSDHWTKARWAYTASQEEVVNPKIYTLLDKAAETRKKFESES